MFALFKYNAADILIWSAVCIVTYLLSGKIVASLGFGAVSILTIFVIGLITGATHEFILISFVNFMVASFGLGFVAVAGVTEASMIAGIMVIFVVLASMTITEVASKDLDESLPLLFIAALPAIGTAGVSTVLIGIVMLYRKFLEKGIGNTG